MFESALLRPNRSGDVTNIIVLHAALLNTILRAVSGNSRDGVCFKLDKQTWRKKQWYTKDNFSKSTH